MQRTVRPTVTTVPVRPTVVRGDEPTGIPLREGETATVAVCVPVAGRVLEDGQYVAGQSLEEETRSFQLRVVGGQWRISRTPSGVLVPASLFTTLYVDVPLYFPDLTGTWLVPDVRWFPRKASIALVMQALAHGRSAYLAGVVQTGFPQDAELSTDGVRITAANTVVDLTQEATDATPAMRRLMRAQLQQTLQAASSSMGVPFPELRITVQQREFSIADDGPPDLSPAPDLPVDPVPLVIDPKGQVARLKGTTTSVVDGLPGLRARGVSFPTVNLDPDRNLTPDRLEYAGLVANTERGTAALVTSEVGGDPQTRYADGLLVPPSYDRFGWLWTARVASNGSAVALDAGGMRSVAAPWLSGYTVRSLRLSREGARVLVVATRNGIGRAFVAGVVRTPDGTPVSLTQGQVVVPDLHDVRDAAWQDADRFVLLGTQEEGSPVAVLHGQVGGPLTGSPVEVPGDAQDAQWIAAGALSDEVWVGTPKRTLVREGAGWTSLPGVHWPTVAG